MIQFIEPNGKRHSGLVEYGVTHGVNGQKSITGTILTNESIIDNIDRGWKMNVDNEYYVVTFIEPKDLGSRVEIEFDAVHEFFYDMSKSMVYDTLEGSNTFEVYLRFIFNGIDYTVNSDVTVNAFPKQNFGMKSRLELFNDIIKTAGVEFSVSGRVVRIVNRVGNDLSTVVKKGFNLNELRLEKNVNDFITVKRGFGAWVDDEDHSKGRLEVEYKSPLADVYGELHGAPVVDERYSVKNNLYERLKNKVESSYQISVTLDMEDLTKAGYEYKQPKEGDYITAINEDLGFNRKIRIVSYTSHYDTAGQLINHDITANSIGSVKKQNQSMANLQTTVNNAINELDETRRIVNHVQANAQGTARNFTGPNDPLTIGYSIREGDIWYDTSGEKTVLYRWNGAEWIDMVNMEQLHRQIDQAFTESQEAKADAEQSYYDSVAEAERLVESESAQWEQSFNDKVADINESISDVSARADEAIQDAGANADLIDTHENILSDIENVTLPNINETLNNVQQNIIPGIEQDISDAWNRVDTALTNAETAQTDANKALDNVNTLDQSVQTSITDINGKLSRKAEQTTVNDLETTVSNHGTSISQNETDIKTKAESSTVDTLNGLVNENSTQISLNAENIGLKADSSTVNQLTGDVETNSANISINADEISRRLTSTEVDNLVDGKGFSTVSYVDSQINESAEGIYGSLADVRAEIPSDFGARNYISLTNIDSYTPYNTIPTVINQYTFETKIVNENKLTVAVSGFNPTGGSYVLSGYMFVDGEPVNENIVSDFNTAKSHTLRKLNSETGYFEYRIHNNDYRFFIHVYNSSDLPEGTVVRFEHLTLNKGEVAFDWELAYEDTANRITALSNDFEVTAEGFTQDLNAFKQTANGQFSNLSTRIETVAGEQTRQYQDLTGELNNKLENSDLSGYATESYVNTEITEGIDGVITRIESVESTQDSLSTSINEVEATAEGNKNLIANIQNDPENTIVGYQQVTETADLYERVIGSSENEINDNVSRIIATSDVIQQEVSSMEFGGRNYFSVTKWLENSSGRTNYEQGTDGSLRILSVDGGSNDIKIADLEPNTNYTMSFSEPMNKRFEFFDANGTRISSSVNKNWDSENTVMKFTTTNDTAYIGGKFYLINGYNLDYPIDVYIQLEKGTVATDRTPAPEDQTAYTDSAVSTVQTQLDNSWAVQTLNSNKDVMSEIAITDSTARIKGKNILLDGNVSMTNAYITDLEALSINAVEGDITRLITDHLEADTITSKHIVSSLSMIDKLFGNEAYIKRLTTKNAFIESIQTTALSADQIVTGEINSAVANTIFLNADSGSFNTAHFIQTAWNNISTQITIDDRGIMISGNDRWRRTHHNQTGLELYNGSGSNNRAGAIGYFKTTYNEADWNENVMLTGGRRLRHSIGMGADYDHVLSLGYTPANTTDRTYIAALEIDPQRDGHITALTEATFEKPVNLTSPRITDANGATGGFLTRPTTLGISMISEGKVSLGIGTTSSWYDRLVVAGNVDLYTDLSMRNFNILRAGRIEFESTGTTYIDASESRMRYWANETHTFVDGNGSAMLQLKSNGYADMYNRLNMHGNDIYNASDFRTTSDRRLKTEIEEYENNILEDFFEPINPVTYFWKEQSKSQEQQFGLIAQETPLISDYDAVSDLWNISMSKQVMVNTFGVKELLNRDNDKENRLRKLEAENKGLKDRINQLEGAN